MLRSFEVTYRQKDGTVWRDLIVTDAVDVERLQAEVLRAFASYGRQIIATGQATPDDVATATPYLCVRSTPIPGGRL